MTRRGARDYIKANVALIFKKEDPRNYRLSWKVMEQCFLVTISWYIKDRIIRSSQHRFPKGISCLTSLINICDELGGLVDNERVVDIVYKCFLSVRLSLVSSMRSLPRSLWSMISVSILWDTQNQPGLVLGCSKAVGGLALGRGIAKDDLQKSLPNLNILGFLWMKLPQVQCEFTSDWIHLLSIAYVILLLWLFSKKDQTK